MILILEGKTKIHLTFCKPVYVKGYSITRALESLTTKIILKFVKLSKSWPMHLNIIPSTLNNQGYVRVS